jgi:nucleolar protein 12
VAFASSVPIATSSLLAGSEHNAGLDAPSKSTQKPAKKSKRSSKVTTATILSASTNEDDAENVPGPSRLYVGEENSDESDDDDEGNILVHEALQPSRRTKAKSQKPKKYVPPGETEEDKNRRTIFVGNLSLDVAKSKVGFSLLIAMS